jgi:DNA-binding XRE family transcriptional regulator
MRESKKSQTDAIDILHRRFYEGKPSRMESLEETRANEEVARSIRTLRTNAGLTQTQLAEIVGATASAISRLEAANYEGIGRNAAPHCRGFESTGRNSFLTGSQIRLGTVYHL